MEILEIIIAILVVASFIGAKKILETFLGESAADDVAHKMFLLSVAGMFILGFMMEVIGVFLLIPSAIAVWMFLFGIFYCTL